jgi:hypothetical protein
MNQTAPDSQQFHAMLALANLRRRVKNGANNFYWIAALSVINSIIALFGGQVTFVIGLGLTQVVDGLIFFLAQQIPQAVTVIRIVGIVVSVGLALVFAAFGYFAGKSKRWAFQVGMGLYALDGLLLLYFQDWLGFGFHIVILWALYGGLKALGQLDEIFPAQPPVAFPKSIGQD